MATTAAVFSCLAVCRTGTDMATDITTVTVMVTVTVTDLVTGMAIDQSHHNDPGQLAGVMSISRRTSPRRRRVRRETLSY